MENRISIGRYVEGDSWIHKLDPRIKIVVNMILLASIFILKSLIALAILNVIFIFTFLSLRTKWTYIFSLMKFLIFIACIIFLFMSLFWPETENIYFKAPHFKIAKNTLQTTFRAVLRLYGMLISTTILTLSTRPMDITRSIDSLLTPLRWVKFPVHIVSMVISLALQFMPVMLDHGKKISEAQAARGLDSIRGNWIVKIKGLKSVWVPIVAAAFTNAIALGAAMDARGYDPYAKRSRYITYKIDWKSIVYLVTSILIFAIIMYVKFGVNLPNWWW